MNWYKIANLEPPLDKMVSLLALLERNQYADDLVKYWKTKTPEELNIIHEKLKDEYFRSLSAIKDEYQDPKQDSEFPEELNNFSEVEYATGTYNRYVWGTQNEIVQIIANGLKMNSGHDDLPDDWYYVHVGDEEWVSILYEEYQRDGPVCELEISNLPDGFFEVEDIDLAGINPERETYPSSSILISKQRIIPPQCINISRCFDTQEIVDTYVEPDDFNSES